MAMTVFSAQMHEPGASESARAAWQVRRPHLESVLRARRNLCTPATAIAPRRCRVTVHQDSDFHASYLRQGSATKGYEVAGRPRLFFIGCKTTSIHDPGEFLEPARLLRFKSVRIRRTTADPENHSMSGRRFRKWRPLSPGKGPAFTGHPERLMKTANLTSPPGDLWRPGPSARSSGRSRNSE